MNVTAQRIVQNTEEKEQQEEQEDSRYDSPLDSRSAKNTLQDSFVHLQADLWEFGEAKGTRKYF